MFAMKFAALCLAFGSLLAICSAPVLAQTPDPCASYSWDVSQERALFASQPTVAVAEGASSARITADRLYQMHLTVQGSVALPVPPSKKVAADPAYAGVATLQLGTPGTYRIAGDSPFWIDVIVAGEVLRPKDYQGQRGCSSPHKIVEFELPAAVPVILEFSSASAPDIRFSVTAAPIAKP
jgi:hypothetical protein